MTTSETSFYYHMLAPLLQRGKPVCERKLTKGAALQRPAQSYCVSVFRLRGSSRGLGPRDYKPSMKPSRTYRHYHEQTHTTHICSSPPPQPKVTLTVSPRCWIDLPLAIQRRGGRISSSRTVANGGRSKASSAVCTSEWKPSASAARLTKRTIGLACSVRESGA